MNIIKEVFKSIFFRKEFEEMESELTQKQGENLYLKYKMDIKNETETKAKKLSKRDICSALVNLCKFKRGDYAERLEKIKGSSPADYYRLNPEIFPRNSENIIMPRERAIEYLSERIKTLKKREELGERLLKGEDIQWDAIAQGRFDEFWS